MLTVYGQPAPQTEVSLHPLPTQYEGLGTCQAAWLAQVPGDPHPLAYMAGMDGKMFYLGWITSLLHGMRCEALCADGDYSPKCGQGHLEDGGVWGMAE